MISLGLWVAQHILRRTVTEQAAKKIGMWAAIPIAIILGALLFVAGKHLYDRGVVEVYQDKQDAKVAVQTRNADQAADAALTNRAVVAEEQNANLVNAIEKAERKDPVKAARGVGDVQQSYFDNLPEPKRTKK